MEAVKIRNLKSVATISYSLMHPIKFSVEICFPQMHLTDRHQDGGRTLQLYDTTVQVINLPVPNRTSRSDKYYHLNQNVFATLTLIRLGFETAIDRNVRKFITNMNIVELKKK